MSSILKKLIYLDNAASTPIDKRVALEIKKTMSLFGNPSSFNNIGRAANKKLKDSRLSIARFLGAHSEEIIFTSSGSEANNLAILGLAIAGVKKNEILTTPIEHPSVIEVLKYLQKESFKITYLKVSKEGIIDLNDLKNKLNPNVFLVSVMYANNEIGTIEPIAKISKIIKEFRKDSQLFFHVDACQATEYLDMNVNNIGVDLLTFNGSKIYGPKGVGVLYKKRGIILKPIIYGGAQEYGLRAGTENLSAISGLAKAISLINKQKENKKVSKLRDYFFDELIKILPDVKINGAIGNDRLPNNINFSVPELSDENLLLEMDKYGVYASSGSACTARSVEPSHVLKAIGVEAKYLRGALRFSLGRQTTKKDIDYVLKILPKVTTDLKKRYKK